MSGPPPPPPGFVLDGDGVPPPPSGFHRSVRGDQSELRQGKPESAWHSAWTSIHDAIFGSPERAEAVASGDLTSATPTTADLANYAMVVGSMGASGAVEATLSKAPGLAGRVAGWVGRNPVKVGAATGALPGILHGDLESAAKGATVGAVTGKMGTGSVATLKRVKDLVSAGKNAEAQALIQALRSEAAAVPSVAAKVEQAAAPAVTTVLDKGKAAAGAHSALMAFAKEAAATNPKVGQKIWILLDESGAPSKVLTPDQAGAAARKGLKTTWVRNLWQ